MSKSVDGARPVPLPKSVDGAATRLTSKAPFFLLVSDDDPVAGARMPTLHVVHDSAQGAYDVDSRMHAAPEPVRFFARLACAAKHLPSADNADSTQLLQIFANRLDLEVPTRPAFILLCLKRSVVPGLKSMN